MTHFMSECYKCFISQKLLSSLFRLRDYIFQMCFTLEVRCTSAITNTPMSLKVFKCHHKKNSCF